jgi:micrococcal nuclease
MRVTRRARTPGALLLLLVLLGLAYVRGRDGTGGDDVADSSVVRVVDGDTIVVRLDGADERVRLIGIDTPESVDPRTPVECFGKEASDHAASLLPRGTAVRLVRDVEARDRFDRLLAYVYRAGDGLFVNLALAEAGYADVATFPPNVAHVDELTAAVARARAEGRGLWSACGGPDEPSLPLPP